jgi:hypothetical protein
VSEGREQIDLTVSERANFGTSDGNYPNRLTGAHQRDGQYGAETKASGAVSTLGVLISFRLQIGDMNRSPVKDGTSDGETTR